MERIVRAAQVPVISMVVVAGCLVGVVSMAILAFAHGSVWELYLAEAIMGVGFGLVFSAMSSLIVNAVPPAQTGVASGMNANIRTIGGSIGAAVMASIVTADLGPGGCRGRPVTRTASPFWAGRW